MKQREKSHRGNNAGRATGETMREEPRGKQCGKSHRGDNAGRATGGIKHEEPQGKERGETVGETMWEELQGK